MKTINKIASAALMALSLSACVDMDTMPLGDTITAEQKKDNLDANPDRLEASVTAIATAFNTYGAGVPNYERHNDFGYPALMMFMDSRTADFVTEDIGYNWFADGTTYDDLKNTDERYATSMFWTIMYKQIYACNDVAAVVDPETEDSSLQFYLAQALGSRAFDYFVLAQMYQHTYAGHQGDPCVPVITNENSAEAAADGCARSTVAETYDQILKDINTAIDLLSKTEKVRSDKRYLSLEAAYGLRARINLVMQNYAEAAADAEKAMAGGKPLSMAEAKKPGFNDSKAANWLWAVVVAETDRVVTTGICNFPSMMGSLCYGYASVGAWRRISAKLFKTIPASDVRKGWWLDENGQSENLSAAQVAQAAEYECPAYCQMKYEPYQNVMAQSTNASDVPLMRVEEMYLILAEAQAMTDPAKGAQTLIDFVKTYRDPSYTFRGTTTEEVVKEILRQRRIELWGEGLSYFDVQRLNTGVDRRGAGFEPACVFNIPAGDNALIYRIPNSEIEANVLITEKDVPEIIIPEAVSDEE